MRLFVISDSMRNAELKADPARALKRIVGDKSITQRRYAVGRSNVLQSSTEISSSPFYNNLSIFGRSLARRKAPDKVRLPGESRHRHRHDHSPLSKTDAVCASSASQRIRFLDKPAVIVHHVELWSKIVQGTSRLPRCDFWK
jgi:hypothetical protein